MHYLPHTIKYPNPNSGIESVTIHLDAVEVKFKRATKTYTYNANELGWEVINQMEYLARIGKGLNSFINKHIRQRRKPKAA